jgi:hypothetical protein
MTMSEMILLSENELEMIAGGQGVVGTVSVVANVNATSQVAVGVAVLSTSNVDVHNTLTAVQVGVAVAA